MAIFTRMTLITALLRWAEILVLGLALTTLFPRPRHAGLSDQAEPDVPLATSGHDRQVDGIIGDRAWTASTACLEASTKMRMLSIDPLMIHLEDFVSAKERKHLLQLAQPRFKRSTVLGENMTSAFSSRRSSSTAYLSKHDKVVRAIAKRAAEFQGYPAPRKRIDLQVTKYEQGQEYQPHFDWFPQDVKKTRNRLSTFFVILEADCADCGTQFPDLGVNWSHWDARWCRYMDCQQDMVTTRPIAGSALYWVNLHPTGEGRDDMAHAGLPLSNGTKYGLNIWTEIDDWADTRPHSS